MVYLGGPIGQPPVFRELDPADAHNRVCAGTPDTRVGSTERHTPAF